MSSKAKISSFWIFSGLGLSLLLFPIILVVAFVIFISSVNSEVYSSNYSFQENTAMLNPLVLMYRDTVEKYASEYGVAEYVPIILAIIQQESGGSPETLVTDPMQSSESYCGRVGCINNPETSISEGVKYFSQVLNKANGDIKLALQSYNFGIGFIDYVNERGGQYSFDLAVSFSRLQYEKLKDQYVFTCLRESAPEGACYGDVFYVDAVMQYVITIGGTGQWSSPVASGMHVTSPFGMRLHPIHGDYRMHNGIDFSCQRSEIPIFSVDSGSVVFSGTQGGYGNVVIVQHESNLYSHYAHLSKRGVSAGDSVQKGQQIGNCGTTGSSTGLHLHLEARSHISGGQFDPMTLFE